MRIGGVASEDNTTDILTKNLQPHLHQKHCAHLNISAHKTKHRKKGTTLTNNSIRLTSISQNLINSLIFQSLSHQEVVTIPEDRKLTLVQQTLPHKNDRVNAYSNRRLHITRRRRARELISLIELDGGSRRKRSHTNSSNSSKSR
jgi:hypothetical protein